MGSVDPASKSCCKMQPESQIFTVAGTCSRSTNVLPQVPFNWAMVEPLTSTGDMVKSPPRAYRRYRNCCRLALGARGSTAGSTPSGEWLL